MKQKKEEEEEEEEDGKREEEEVDVKLTCTIYENYFHDT